MPDRMADYYVLRMITTARVLLAAAAAVAVLGGCDSPPPVTWEQKLESLKAVGERGADAHYVLLTSNKTPSKEVCMENYFQFADKAPSDSSLGTVSQEWFELHRQYFVDSCVSGQPRRPLTRPTSSTPVPSGQPDQGRPAPHGP